MKPHETKTQLHVNHIDPCPLPFCATRDDLAPLFTADVFFRGEIHTINLEDFKEKWKILFFYASDFTFV